MWTRCIQRQSCKIKIRDFFHKTNTMKANRGYRPPAFNNRGPGGANRGSGSGPADRSGPGPLMTEHLQLQDLDLELALLRRKREIIVQQQTMHIGNNHPNQYDPPSLFSQQQYNPPAQYEQASNFSRFYDSAYPGDSSGPNNEPYRQGLKRSAPIDPWQSGPSKRLSAKDRLGPASRAMHSVPQPLMRETFRPPKSMSNSSTAGTRRLPSLMGRAGFIPNKIMKPKSAGVNKPGNRTGTKPGSGPNKLNSYPESVRQNLVAKASELTHKSYKEDKLEADKPVSRSVMGRLELALGTVFKEMKLKYGEEEPNAGIFRNISKQRALKQAIRDRIRNVMLGKIVGNAAEITKIYRDQYPTQHDEEMLQLALKAGPPRRLLPFNAIITEDPTKFFKVNFDKLLSNQLDKIFAEVTKACGPENKQPMNETLEAALNEFGITKDPDLVGKPVDSVIAAESADVKAVEEKEVKEENEEKEVKEEKEEEEKNADAEGTKDNQPTNENTDSVEANSEAKDTENENVDATKTSDEANDTLQVQEGVESNPEWYNHKFYARVFESLCKRRLPSLLPKYKETLMTLLKKEEQFQAAFDKIREATEKLIEENRRNIENRENRENVENSDNTENGMEMEVAMPSAEKKASERLPYFVKVLGRPSLPKRKVMQTFLDQFHPKTIKKHRGIHNLLFVGFNDKQDYDNILAATMTVVGHSTIDVRVSEPTKAAETSQTETEKADDDVQKSDNVDQVLNDSLDNQIGDLLSAIREEEEGKTSDDNADNEVECNEEETIEMKTDNQTTEVKTESGASEVKTEFNGDAEVKEEIVENKNVEAVKNEAKETGKTTPTRASARIATSTPNTIRTRRASKLSQN